MRGEATPPGLSSVIVDVMTTLQFGGRPTPDQISAYEKSVQAYIAEYRDYLLKQHGLECVIYRTLALRPLVVNTGRVPAEKCRVLLHFPEGVEVRRRPPKSLRPPAAPTPPSPLDWFHGLAFGPPDIPRLMGIGRVPLVGDRTPRICKKNSTEVEYPPEDVMHGASFATRLPSVYMVLPEEAMPSVEVPFEIHATNLPEPASGVLTLFLDYVEVEPWTLGLSQESDDEEDEEDEG